VAYSGNSPLVSVNEVAQRRARLVLGSGLTVRHVYVTTLDLGILANSPRPTRPPTLSDYTGRRAVMHCGWG